MAMEILKDDCELTLDVLQNINFKDLLLNPSLAYERKNSEAKTSDLGLSPPTNAQAVVNQFSLVNCIQVPATPPPVYSQAAQHDIPRSSFEIPPTPTPTPPSPPPRPPSPTDIQVLPPSPPTYPSTPRNSFEIPSTPPAMDARQAIPQNILHTPAADQDDLGVDKKMRQPQRRRKKHRPKIVVDGKLGKPPKTPKVPKTPKTPKAPKTPKRESCKRVLDFNLKVKDEGDDRVVLVLKDDLQEEVKNSLKGSLNVEDGVQLVDIPNPEFNLDFLIRERVTSKRTSTMRKRRIYLKGCSSNTLIVYKRKFQPNQCQKNSRKLGPNFPRIYKKQRTRRLKRTFVKTLFSIIAPKIGKRRVRTEVIIDAEPFQCLLSWGAKCRRKSSKTLTRRRILSFPTAKNINPVQSLSALPGHDHENLILPSPTVVNPIDDQFSPFHSGEDLGNNVNLPSPTALILNPESEQLPLPKLGVVTLNHMNSNCDQPSPPVQTVGASVPTIDFEQFLPPPSQDLGVERLVNGNSVKKGKNRFIVNLSSSVQASVTDDIEDCVPRSGDFERKMIDFIQGSEAFHIGNECNNQLVVQNQNGNGALVKIDPPKKAKISAKVDLDEETLRVSNLLMDNKGTDPFEDMDDDKKKWWKEQREIFRGRIDSFTARLHLIQGNRSFSPWKGSVVDSIVGVYLTQNVSDHLSSSAFMTLAAKFPPKATSNSSEVIVCSQEPVGSGKEADGQLHDEKESLLEMDMPLTKSDPVVDEIPGEILMESFCDKNAETNEPCLRVPQNLDTVDHLQKTSKPSFNLNVAFWDPLGIMGGKGVANKKKERKHDINGPNPSLGRDRVTKNGGVKGKNPETTPRKKKINVEEKVEVKVDWDELRKKYSSGGRECGRNIYNRDSVDWEAVRCSTVDEIAKTIKARGMNNVLANRIKDFLDRIYKDHGSLDLEWLRDVPPHKAKEYLLSIDGIGLKSVECVRLLCLYHLAFPVDTNVARVAVRLGWVPIQPLAESLMLHDLNAYPSMDSIQKYLWPRLSTLSQKELYELHYQMITFGKVFCTMRKPNCNACPMKGECRHYASAVASTRFALPKPDERRMTASNIPVVAGEIPSVVPTQATKPSLLEFNISDSSNCREDQSCEPIIGLNQNPNVVITPVESIPFQEIEILDSCDYKDDLLWEPIIEIPLSPGPIDIETQLASDLEDLCDYSDDCEIPTLRLNTEEFRETLRDILTSKNPSLQGDELSRALVSLTEDALTCPVQQLKYVARLRTVHQVYELPDSHPLLDRFEKRQPNDNIPYLLAIWKSAGEADDPERCSTSNHESNSESFWGTILIPCRSATRGAFPLSGTYFQINEVFADDETSSEPIRVPRAWLWYLPKRVLYCGASASSILRGLSLAEIQFCFWDGFICVRGFDKTTRVPQPLAQRFHVNTTAVGKRKRDDE